MKRTIEIVDESGTVIATHTEGEPVTGIFADIAETNAGKIAMSPAGLVREDQGEMWWLFTVALDWVETRRASVRSTLESSELGGYPEIMP